MPSRVVCSAATLALLVAVSLMNESPEATSASGAAALAIPESHHGAWKGPNRLWTTDPKKPARSDGAITVMKDGIDYRWSLGEKEHQGKIRLHGQAAALRLTLEDTFHSPKEMNLHGHLADGVIRTYGTYGAGPGQPEWGWILELDWRDPEAFVLRMFNVVPGHGVVPAVVLDGARPS